MTIEVDIQAFDFGAGMGEWMVGMFGMFTPLWNPQQALHVGTY